MKTLFQKLVDDGWEPDNIRKNNRRVRKSNSMAIKLSLKKNYFSENYPRL